ncbi:MAG: extracellular solute-binding protein [Treponema sp.]|nr:extracellular solute-binding protein [Treponema sp.]
MKKIICILIILAFAIPLAFASGSKDKKPSGKITIYTSMYEYVTEAVKADLQKRFPGCTIEFVYGGTGVLQARIASEQASGRLGCDILMVAEPAYSLELKEKGMLHPFISSERSSLAFDYDPEGCWYPVRISNMVLAFNPARNARNTVPNSFYDFAHNTGARGAISMRNPLVSGTTMATVTALRDKYGHGYFDALGSQRVKIDYGSDETLSKLESGECRVAMILEESILRIRQVNNSRLEIIYPTDGVVVIPSTIMIINNKWSANKNTSAAEAITNWFLGEEGQNAIVNGWMHSVRADFPRIPNGSIPTEEILANSIPVIWDNIFRQKEDIRSRFETGILSSGR